MKDIIEPTNTGHELSDEDFIILRTDLQGTITYANRCFIRLSGFEENELLSQPHKMLRHPDMPRTVFRLMWDTLESDREFFGYLKYLRKDGGYFWTFANLTPSFDDDHNVNGCFSVLRKAHPARLSYFSELYHEMIEAEKQFSSDQESMDASSRLLTSALGGKEYNEFIIAA